MRETLRELGIGTSWLIRPPVEFSGGEAEVSPLELALAEEDVVVVEGTDE